MGMCAKKGDLVVLLDSEGYFDVFG